MTFLAIVLGTLVAGIGSVWIAAALSFGALARYTQHMLSLAAGALLATSFLHLLPEAFESQAGAHDLFITLLLGLVFFFLLDKAELWHHGHEHHHHHGGSHVAAGAGHVHAHAHDHAHAGHSLGRPGGAASGTWTVLAGDSVHCFGDGVLIASAFVADLKLGALAALAVMAHEVPHHMGDLVVLRGTDRSRKAAVIKVSLAGAITAIGGVAGYALLGAWSDYLPYFLALASSSFIYVALADLIPQLQRHLSSRETLGQILWLAVGIGMVLVVSSLGHAH